jgi:8-oxo-dGTP pyrophosphatase MutT (NUDIX family)
MTLESLLVSPEMPHPYIHCEEINPHEPLLFGGAKGLIFLGDTQDIVVYRRDLRPKAFPGYLDLIGGGSDVKPNGELETPYETAEREAREEAGIRLAPESILYAARYEFDGLAGLEGGPINTGVFFAAKIPEPGEAGLCLGEEGDQEAGVMRMPISELVRPDRTDVWPAFQQLARQYYEDHMLTDSDL